LDDLLLKLVIKKMKVLPEVLMSDREEWLQSMQNEDDGLTEFIERTNSAAKRIPFAQERKRELNALKSFVVNALNSGSTWSCCFSVI
jgi:hypothetical protein